MKSRRQPEKKIINEVSRLNELYRKKWRTSGVEPVEKPYQKGYTASFVVRADFGRSKNGEILGEILQKINATRWHSTPDFVYNVRGERVDKRPVLRKLSKNQWDRLDEDQRKRWARFFVKEEQTRTTCYGSFKTENYRFAYPYMYEIKVEPFFVTHRKINLPEVESELTKRQNRAYREHTFEKHGRLRGHSRKEIRRKGRANETKIQTDELTETDNEG